MRNFGPQLASAVPSASVMLAAVQGAAPALQILAWVLIAACICTVVFLAVVAVYGKKKQAARAERILTLLLNYMRPAPPPRTPGKT